MRVLRLDAPEEFLDERRRPGIDGREVLGIRLATVDGLLLRNTWPEGTAAV